MKKNDLFNFLKQDNISTKLVNKEESETIIKKIISIANGDSLHYLWSNYKSNSFIIRKKLSCNLDLYIKALTNIIVYNDIYFIIDKVCFSDSEDNLVIKLSKIELLELLCKFYWEFDEIYILDTDCTDFISINHNFELSLYGDKRLDLCKKTLERIEELP